MHNKSIVLLLIFFIVLLMKGAAQGQKKKRLDLSKYLTVKIYKAGKGTRFTGG